MALREAEKAKGRFPIIPPMAPALTTHVPEGPDWVHEVKFDGWRAQLHITGDEATIYSKRGADITKRFKQLRPLFRCFPVKNGIIDCELLACAEDGLPNFRALMELGNKATLVLVVFDLLHLDGVRLTPIAIEERKAILQTLTARMATPYVQFSEGFDDPAALMKACAKMDWEGIVSKRKGSAWRAKNTRRWEMFKA